jgi:hypothetical protein
MVKTPLTFFEVEEVAFVDAREMQREFSVERKGFAFSA